MGEWKYSSTILDLSTRLSEWSASHPCHFTAGGKVPSVYCVGGWVGLRASLVALEKRRSCTVRNRTWAVQPIAISGGHNVKILYAVQTSDQYPMLYFRIFIT
jgi:hypothetical protein